MRFIDLFAGLGGFHQALDDLGGECVFASELNQDLAQLYELNFGIRPKGDIREVDVDEIPDHDILCAGFPCQPFSKAGDQKGLECPQWGDLIDYVIEILRVKAPRFFIIENVPNLIRHNGGKTWSDICSRMADLGYDTSFAKLSPHMFGVPQKRERAFLVGDRNGLGSFEWPAATVVSDVNISSILDADPKNALPLNENHLKYLNAWQEFLDLIPASADLPSFPIWAMEFGASYPLDGLTPYARNYSGLSKYKGAFGKPLRRLSSSSVEAALPNYARTKLESFPTWKIDFIQKNRAFYKLHKATIDPWLKTIKEFPPSFQKLEWNIKGGERDIWKYIIQFRASGIRVKRTETAPSLIAMTTSQVPIIAWQKRYMTPRECSRLQSMGGLKHIPETKNGAYKAFGNAVNVEVVKQIVSRLFRDLDSLPSEHPNLAAE